MCELPSKLLNGLVGELLCRFIVSFWVGSRRVAQGARKGRATCAQRTRKGHARGAQVVCKGRARGAQGGAQEVRKVRARDTLCRHIHMIDDFYADRLWSQGLRPESANPGQSTHSSLGDVCMGPALH